MKLNPCRISSGLRTMWFNEPAVGWALTATQNDILRSPKGKSSRSKHKNVALPRCETQRFQPRFLNSMGIICTLTPERKRVLQDTGNRQLQMIFKVQQRSWSPPPPISYKSLVFSEEMFSET
jgi:hypothetical protein